MKKRILSYILSICIISALLVMPTTIGFAEKNDIVGAYTEILKSYTSRKSVVDSFVLESKYTLYDIDKDNIWELIIDDANGLGGFEIYTYHNKAIYCGDIYAYNCDAVYAYPDGNGIVVHDGGMGTDHIEYVNLYTLEDNQINLNYITLCSTEESTYEELRNLLAKYERIPNFVSTKDLSLLNTITDENNKPQEIRIFLNGQELFFDQPPIMADGNRVLVPIRVIFEALGYSVDWYGDTQTAVAKKGNNTITVRINNSEILYSRGIYLCDVPPQIVSERTLVPVRAISECAGCSVDWNGEAKTVIVTSNER